MSATRWPPVPADSDLIAPERGTEPLEFVAGQTIARRIWPSVRRGCIELIGNSAEQGTVLHGQLDLPTQMREAQDEKDLLHSQYDQF